jgi:prepilin-type N-terminal cleavage/methylation domain-containing protein
MKLRKKRLIRGFTLLELMMVLAAIAAVASVILPAFVKASGCGQDVACLNNLKQVGLSFRLWAGDNGEEFPMHVLAASGGTMELGETSGVAPHFAVMSNEIGTTKTLVCRADAGREPAMSFGLLQETNVSYFINLSASEGNPRSWLVGDRNLMVGQSAGRGLVSLTNKSLISWPATIHNKHGVIAFADGSAQFMNSRQLLKSLRAQTNLTSRLVFP